MRAALVVVVVFLAFADVAGAAAPVFDRYGNVSCAVATLAFASELHEANVAEIGEKVAACAARITEHLGGRHPDTDREPSLV